MLSKFKNLEIGDKLVTYDNKIFEIVLISYEANLVTCKGPVGATIPIESTDFISELDQSVQVIKRNN